MPFDSLWLLSSFGGQKTAHPLRSSFLLHGAIDSFFWQLRGRCTLLDFKFKFQESTTNTNSPSFKFSLMLVTGQKLLASEQIKYSAFSRTFWYLETGQEIISSKKFNEITISKSKIFIYLFIILFRHGLSVLFYNSKLGPHLLPLRVASPPQFVFLPFSRIPQIWPTRSTFLQSSVILTPIKQHPSMLINFFRIFRKPQVGELDQGWS